MVESCRCATKEMERNKKKMKTKKKMKRKKTDSKQKSKRFTYAKKGLQTPRASNDIL